MKVVIERKEIVGTLKTPFLGSYIILAEKNSVDGYEMYFFTVMDEEGFQNKIVVHGDFIVVPSPIPEFVDVKRVLTEKEEAEYKEPLPSDEYKITEPE